MSLDFLFFFKLWDFKSLNDESGFFVFLFQGHYPFGASPGPGHYSARSFHPPHGNNFHSKSPPIFESRPRTAGPYLNADQLPPSLPSIHHGLYHSSWGEDEDMGSGEGSRNSEDRLKWIDALNKWIPEQVGRFGFKLFVLYLQVSLIKMDDKGLTILDNKLHKLLN